MGSRKKTKKVPVIVEPEELQEIEVTVRLSGEVTLTTNAKNIVEGVRNAERLSFNDFVTLKPKASYNFFEKPDVRGVWVVDND